MINQRFEASIVSVSCSWEFTRNLFLLTECARMLPSKNMINFTYQPCQGQREGQPAGGDDFIVWGVVWSRKCQSSPWRCASLVSFWLYCNGLKSKGTHGCRLVERSNLALYSESIFGNAMECWIWRDRAPLSNRPCERQGADPADLGPWEKTEDTWKYYEGIPWLWKGESD